MRALRGSRESSALCVAPPAKRSFVEPQRSKAVKSCSDALACESELQRCATKMARGVVPRSIPGAKRVSQRSCFEVMDASRTPRAAVRTATSRHLDSCEDRASRGLLQSCCRALCDARNTRTVRGNASRRFAAGPRQRRHRGRAALRAAAAERNTATAALRTQQRSHLREPQSAEPYPT